MQSLGETGFPDSEIMSKAIQAGVIPYLSVITPVLNYQFRHRKTDTENYSRYQNDREMRDGAR